MSTYFLCDPLAVLPSPEGNIQSSWAVLVEVPSNDADPFLSTVRLTALEVLRVRLGDESCMKAMRQMRGRPPRSVPAERQYQLKEEILGDEPGIWNGLRYWFTDRLSEQGSDDSWS